MESTANKKIQYKICSRCIMDTTSDPNLVLDENGVCNYCHEYDDLCKQYSHYKDNGEKQLSEIINKMKLGILTKYIF